MVFFEGGSGGNWADVFTMCELQYVRRRAEFTSVITGMFPEDAHHTACLLSCAPTTAPPSQYIILVAMQLAPVRDVVPISRHETGPRVDLTTPELVIIPIPLGIRLLGSSSIY